MEYRIWNMEYWKKIKKATQNSRRGFTLIELLVFISIISVLFSIGYASYRNYAQRQAFLSLARQIQVDLELARNLANSGTKARCGNTVLDGFRIIYSTNGNIGTYRIQYVCNGMKNNYDYPDSTNPKVGNIDLSKYQTSFNPNDFIFKSLKQGINCPTGCPNGPSITLTSLALNNRKVIISINQNGDVLVKEQ